MSPTKKKVDMGDFEDDEVVGDTEEVVATPADVLDMADIYLQTVDALKDAPIKPTSEDIQKMTVSIFIGRNQHRNMASYKTAPVPDFKTAEKFKSAPEAPPAKGNAIDQYRACAKCGKALPPKYKDGKDFPYYSCYTCKGVTYDDGSFHPWPSNK